MYVVSVKVELSQNKKQYMLLSVTVEGYMEQRWEVHYCWDICKV
jgi:hypothetical protein